MQAPERGPLFPNAVGRRAADTQWFFARAGLEGGAVGPSPQWIGSKLQSSNICVA
jgi:hypothetical protein